MHECSLCYGLHPRVRLAHGIYGERVRETHNADYVLKHGSWGKDRAWSELIDFEARMYDLSKQLNEWEDDLRLGRRYGIKDARRVDRGTPWQNSHEEDESD